VFAGRVPHREVSRYYSLIDLLVFPRKSMRLTETVTPLKPLEAMAQGRLVIASDVGGHRELIEHGVTVTFSVRGTLRRWLKQRGWCLRTVAGGLRSRRLADASSSSSVTGVQASDATRRCMTRRGPRFARR